MAEARERRREVGRSSGPLRRAASGRVRREPSAPLAPVAIIDEDMTPAGAANDAAPMVAEDNPLSPALIGTHVPEGALRFTGVRKRRGGGAGIVASLLLHGCGVALAAWFIAAAPPALEAGGEEAIPVEVVIAGSEDSLATQSGARGEAKVEIPLPPDAPPVEIALPTVDVPPAPEAEVKVALPEVALPPPDAPPPVEVALPAVDVAPPDAPPPVRLAVPQVAVAPLEAPAPVHVDLPAVDLPPPSPPSEVEFALPAVNVPPPEVPQPVVIAAAPPHVAETKPPEETKPVEMAKPPVEPKPTEAKPTPPPEKPRAVAKPPEKPKPQQAKRTRQVAARPPAEKPAPRRAEAPKPEAKPSPAARGRGDAGAGDSDSTRAASTRGGGNPGAGGGAVAAANYTSRVSAHLARFKTYPEQARERGVTGRAVVSFTLTPGGQVVSASLAGSSGAAMLDSATLAMVRRASPFPPAPPGAQLSFTIPINYNLR